MAHLGRGLFVWATQGQLQTTAFIFRKEPDTEKRNQSEGVYFRLVREKDAEAKRTAFESGLSALRAGQPHPLVFTPSK